MNLALPCNSKTITHNTSNLKSTDNRHTQMDLITGKIKTPTL